MSLITPDRKRAIAALVRSGRMSRKQIAHRFGIPVYVVDQIAGGQWSGSDVAFLRQNYQMRGPRACARVLGRTPDEVMRKAHEMGLMRFRVIRGGNG